MIENTYSDKIDRIINWHYSAFELMKLTRFKLLRALMLPFIFMWITILYIPLIFIVFYLMAMGIIQD